MTERILMPVDDTPASEHAVDYAAALMSESKQIFLHLVHVEPIRAGHQAAEDPEFQRARERSGEIIGKLRDRLQEAGVDPGQVDSGFLAIAPNTPFEEAVLDVARDQQCTTIAVGRKALPWFKEVFHKHPADALVHHAYGFTLWVVES